MPKIVDHEKLRQEIAEQAVRLFLRRGYSALGMREIAAQLGVSKSALYHYFPSKRDLFAAAGQVAVGRMASAFVKPPGAPGEVEGMVSSILAGTRALDENFRDEVALLTDYLRNVEGEAEAARGLTEANAAIEASVAAIVGAEIASLVLSLSYGFLLQRVLAPGMDFAQFEADLRHLLGLQA